MEEYKTLKINEDEIKMLKELLATKKADCLIKLKNEEEKDVNKLLELEYKNNLCGKLLTILDYLQR